MRLRPDLCRRIQDQLARGEYRIASDLVADRVLSWWAPPRHVAA